MEYNINHNELAKFLRNNGLLIVEQDAFLNLTNKEQEKKNLLQQPFTTVDMIAKHNLIRKSKSAINKWMASKKWKENVHWFWDADHKKRLVKMETVKEYRKQHNIL